jgi:hypothetical protein
MRSQLVSELAKEALGPRTGIREELPEDPRNEYIAGVLSPKGAMPLTDPDTDSGLVGEAQDYDEDNSDVDGASYDFVQPALDPRALPHSMGISFTAESNGKPSLKLCVTWARYHAESDRWKRQPRAYVSPVIEIDDAPQRHYVKAGGTKCKKASEAEISLHLISRKVGDRLWHISVYLVNEIRSADRARTEEHIFQPQLRIKTTDRTRVRPEPGISDDPTERELDFLFRERAVMGRGHLCAAVWEKVDPERKAPTQKLESQRPQNPPFMWVDAAVVDKKYGARVRKEFQPPDLRTEFIPVFPVLAPNLAWDARWGKSPELSAQVLSETYEPSELRSKLSPLVDGYEKWIKLLEKRVGAQKADSPVQSILSRCKEIHRRMHWGLDLITSDEDVRLSFCFGNKALDMQSRWTRNEGMTWHPFQLAYVLMVLESSTRPESADRDVCDLLWVPTGTGKTEAYLLISAILLAYRRREAQRRNAGDRTGGGVAVISRYTLRLLTIQQFRRTLKLITACEYLRVYGLASGDPVGWRPSECKNRQDFLWGTSRFSIGLWVGVSVRPNRLGDIYIRETGEMVRGAISILKGFEGEGEPAQILSCPVCDSLLAIPEGGLEAQKQQTIHFVIESSTDIPKIESALKRAAPMIQQHGLKVESSKARNFGRAALVLTIAITGEDQITSEEMDEFWKDLANSLAREQVVVNLLAARASRPGYFIETYLTAHNTRKDLSFEIYCPNPECPLNSNVLWAEGVPLDSGWIDEEGQTGKALRAHDKPLSELQCSHLDVKGRRLSVPDGLHLRIVPHWRRTSLEGFACRWLASSIPIPALTVDEQIYSHPPSFLISTVDKFARLPFEPRCAALFGNVEFFHARFGYYRPGLSAFGSGAEDHPSGAGGGVALHVRVPTFHPPDLVIQDELHLIEGPLGSLTGIYEIAIDALTRAEGRAGKYVAATATIRRAEEQVKSVFCRRLLYFPSPGESYDDRFFVRYNPQAHPLESKSAGQLYAGVCAFGKGPLTPLIRVWARLMQSAQVLSPSAKARIDPFWTTVGYFNAVRELAGARNLYRQDIPERVSRIGGVSARLLRDENVVELSSRIRSTELPSILTLLERVFPAARDALFTTSMFGTGVDISRLSLMLVNGQPKTSSAYIQATGRVGRTQGALVVVLYRSTRPRDLSHYEFFCGYHGALHRFVEDISVSPFSPGALGRAAGPVAVGILRNMRNSSVSWHDEESAASMATTRTAREVEQLPPLFEGRSREQPTNRLPSRDAVLEFIKSRIDDWQQTAKRHGNLKYVEYSTPKCPVVLGDPQHEHDGIPVVYHNAPQSLRDVEETTGFQT